MGQYVQNVMREVEKGGEDNWRQLTKQDRKVKVKDTGNNKIKQRYTTEWGKISKQEKKKDEKNTDKSEGKEWEQ